MDFAFEDNHRIKALTSRVNTLNNSCLLSISRLNNNRSILLVRPSYNFRHTSNTYLEASFVKVVDVVVKDPILSNSLLHLCKLR